jgi:hypothetical protein
MPSPLKMVSHNMLLPEAEGGETALVKAAEMGVDLVRYDFRYHRLTTPGGWQWDATGSNRWNDLLEPVLRWTRQHGMRTLVDLLAYKVPPHCRGAMNAKWREHGGSGDLDERDCTLWAAWAAANGVDLGVPTPRDFAEALVDRLAQGQADGDYDVAGFCILNEPNTKPPGEANWRALRMPSGATFTTADYCGHMCDWVKDRIHADHEAELGQAVTVVNLYSYRHHWRARAWRSVAENPNLDVLGIDIYWDQFLGLFALCKPWSMGRVARQVGKPWWLVETAGAHGAGGLWKRPSCRQVGRYARNCSENGASGLGFFRIWGDYGSRLEVAGAYNIFTDPGPSPSPTEDGGGDRYWETIRDL